MDPSDPLKPWTALGWSEHDLELLRHHSTAMGIQIAIPPKPAEPIKPPGSPYQSRPFLRHNPLPPPIAQRAPGVPVSNTRRKKLQSLVTHVVIVMDGSGSMFNLRHQVVQVVDNQIKWLAQRSKELNQETRVTVYVFDATVECVIPETDVLRLPSLADYYEPDGMTALCAATTEAIDDLSQTFQKYGDHAFILYLFTDGQENASGWEKVQELPQKLKTLPDNWTVAAFVPNQNGKIKAQDYGFPKGNVAVWDPTSAAGIEEAGRVLQTATDTFMVDRSTTGVRKSVSLFDIGASVVNDATIKAANLTPLPYKQYSLVPIPRHKDSIKPDDWDIKHPRKPWKANGGRIDEFIQNVNEGKYRVGQGFYQLTEGKSERIQPSKEIAVVDKITDRVYVGDGARQLLGLPDMEVRVKPSAADKYLIFVQSKSPNRLLVVGARLLIMN